MSLKHEIWRRAAGGGWPVSVSTPAANWTGTAASSLATSAPHFHLVKANGESVQLPVSIKIKRYGRSTDRNMAAAAVMDIVQQAVAVETGSPPTAHASGAREVVLFGDEESLPLAERSLQEIAANLPGGPTNIAIMDDVIDALGPVLAPWDVEQVRFVASLLAPVFGADVGQLARNIASAPQPASGQVWTTPDGHHWRYEGFGKGAWLFSKTPAGHAAPVSTSEGLHSVTHWPPPGWRLEAGPGAPWPRLVPTPTR